MHNTFITKIHIDKVRHLENFDIVLSDTECKHLILTGKNGSGKTSLLEAMRENILDQQNLPLFGQRIPKIIISHSHEISNSSSIVYVYFSASRNSFDLPKAVETVNIMSKTEIRENLSPNFLKYILSLDYQLYGAQNDNNKELESNLHKWFDNFKKALQDIYDCTELKLQRDTKNLAFKIEMPGREPFALNEMADGYRAFLEIYMELIMRFENAGAVVEYGQSAIVLIDELETHLHVELQKRALPFLTRVFPNVQFIVTTHSPFVITSLANAVVYDLEKHEQLENPSLYSFESVVESFLDTSMYSQALRGYFERYKELCYKERTPEETEEFLRAKTELELMSPASKELYLAFNALEEVRKAAQND